jgi:hypothetical protein
VDDAIAPVVLLDLEPRRYLLAFLVSQIGEQRHAPQVIGFWMHPSLLTPSRRRDPSA